MKYLILIIIFLISFTFKFSFASPKNENFDFIFNCINIDSLFNSEFFQKDNLYQNRKLSIIKYFKDFNFKVLDYKVNFLSKNEDKNIVYVLIIKADLTMNNQYPEDILKLLKSNILILNKINSHWYFKGIILEPFEENSTTKLELD